MTITSSGLSPNQSVFDTTGTGLPDAKRSMVDMLNVIFSRNSVTIDRSESITDIDRSTPITEYLMWKQGVSDSVVETLPPQTEYEFVVYSLEQRDDLLLDNNFLSRLIDGESIRVLLDGLSNQDAPQWVVWIASIDNIPEETTDPDAVLTPSQADVFNTWSRVAGASYYPTGSTIPTGSEALSWDFIDNSVTSTVNSASLIGFLSPNQLLNYTHSVTVSSTNADDDSIGLIVAFDVIDGVPHSLVAERCMKNSNVGQAWSLTHWSGTTRTIVINGEDTIAAHVGTEGWSTAGDFLINVVRKGSTVTVKTSQKGTLLLDDATTLVYNIPSDSPFYGPKKFGYSAFSQASATYKDITLTGYGNTYIVNNPSVVFDIAKSYDHVVDTLIERNDLITSNFPVLVGERVLVNGNDDTSGLWTVWKYLGQVTTDTDSKGFQLVRYQYYNTSDFYSQSDWYADGYTSTTPPVVTYATVGDRNVAENPNPTSSFVKIKDDGTGVWVWTAYEDGNWTVVARQNGTVQFSDALYKNTDTINTDPISNSDIDKFSTRDGSWEIRVLIDVFKTSAILTDLEKNELFFSLLHFVHSQQNQVNWAFKTSFLNLGGYNESITQSPVTPIDNTQNLLDYIEEVKPYRVKTRSFSRIVTPETDYANVAVQDYDFPPYYDSALNVHRILNVNDINDLAIIQSTSPYKEWYQYSATPFVDLDDYTATTWNPIRHFNIAMTFDRVDHAPVIERYLANYVSQIINFDVELDDKIVQVLINDAEIKTFSVDSYTLTLNSTYSQSDIVSVIVRMDYTENDEAYRIYNYYVNTTDNEEKNVTELLTKNQNSILFGGKLTTTDYDYITNAAVSQNEVEEVINDANTNTLYGIADPAHKRRPEELVVCGTTESVQFNITSNSTGGVITKYKISSAIPMNDMFAPKETGDYDVLPLDDSNFDTDYVAGTSVAPDGTTKGNYVLKNAAWISTDNSLIAGSLVYDLYESNTSITILPTTPLSDPIEIGSYFLMPPTYLDTGNGVVETKSAGAIWINGERVEFYDGNIDSNAGTIVLTELVRGTHRTAIGDEHSSTFHFTASSGQKNFILSGVTDTKDITVMVYGVLKDSTGKVIITDSYTGGVIRLAQTAGVDFNFAIVGGDVQIQFVKAPATGADIYVTKKGELVHRANSLVMEGQAILEHRFDDRFAGETNY